MIIRMNKVRNDSPVRGEHAYYRWDTRGVTPMTVPAYASSKCGRRIRGRVWDCGRGLMISLRVWRTGMGPLEEHRELVEKFLPAGWSTPCHVPKVRPYFVSNVNRGRYFKKVDSKTWDGKLHFTMCMVLSLPELDVLAVQVGEVPLSKLTGAWQLEGLLHRPGDYFVMSFPFDQSELDTYRPKPKAPYRPTKKKVAEAPDPAKPFSFLGAEGRERRE